MAPKFIIPYRLSGKHGKNDAADAAAICEAVIRSNMRFVPIKRTDQAAEAAMAITAWRRLGT
jgi:transposase